MLQIDEFDFTKFLNNSIALLTFKTVQRWQKINWECRGTTKIMVRIITSWEQIVNLRFAPFTAFSWSNQANSV